MNEDPCFPLTAPASLNANALNTYTAPADTTLAADTIYHVVVDDSDDGDNDRAWWTDTTDEDSDAAEGWSIGNTLFWRPELSHGYAALTNQFLQIKINGYAIDTTAPRVASIDRLIPASENTNADDLTWLVTFDEIVSNVDAADFMVSGTNASLAVSPRDGDDLAYEVTASGGDLAGFTGTVTLSFASDQDIEDAVGNGLTNTAPVGANAAFYQLDNTAPTLTIVNVRPTTSRPFPVAFRFSENVTGFDVRDITLGNATASEFLQSNLALYTALITPTADGVVTVEVLADAAQDRVGNGNTASAQASSTYTNTVPELINAIPDQEATVDVEFAYAFPPTTFNDRDADALTYIATQADTTALPTWLSFDPATRAFSGTPQAADVATVSVKVTASDGRGSVSDEFDIVVSLDTTAPTVAFVWRDSPAKSQTNADTLVWRVTFSEPVTGVDMADFTVSGTNASLAVGPRPGSDVAYLVTASGGDLANLDATVTLSFVTTGHGIVDAAGNALTDTVPVGSKELTYLLDNTAPTVTITDVPLTSNAAFTATFTFLEPVTGFAQADIVLGNATASNFVVTSTTVYTALITPTASAVTVDVPGDAAQDLAGNGNTAATRADPPIRTPARA